MTLFTLPFFHIFSLTLSYLFQGSDIVAYITKGKVFKLTYFNTMSKIFRSIVYELIYADDAEHVAHTEEDI